MKNSFTKMRFLNPRSLCLILFAFGLFGLANNSHAATINAASCNASDVQAAINAAASGDTIQLPACPASDNISWSSIDGVNCSCSAGDYGACMAIYSGLNSSTFRRATPKGITINGAGID